MILMIDNYDSFTYNLVHYLAELGRDVRVARNDTVRLAEVDALAPSAIVISPGPGSPDSAGISLDLVKHCAGRIPILGVCLGHQAIGQAFGGRVIRAARPMHGKTCAVGHDGKSIFRGLPSPFTATRYHSLIVDAGSLPPCLEVSARSPEGEIMALRHRRHPVEGVQFHPESILTEWGRELLANFLGLETGRRGGFRN